MKGPELRGADVGGDTPSPGKADRSGKGDAPKKAETEKKSAPSNARAAEDMKSPGAGKKADRETTQAPADRVAKDKASEPSKTADKPDATPKADPQADAQKGGADKQAGGDRKGIDDAKKVQLSAEKRDRLQSAFRDKGDVKHRTDVDIDISIGRRLPRDWDFAPVPVVVIEIVPEYRDYVFAYVGDEYVICDPVSYEIVAVLPASGGPTYAGGGGGSTTQCSAGLTLTEDERAALVRSVQIVDEEDVSGVTIGWEVPQDIELRSFPEPIVSRTGKLASCRYFIVEGQIAIVDPDADKVVLLVEQQ